MKTVGIIAEFNPFHNGHKYIIDSVKQEGNRVVCVIGDDFTQRGDVAIISKYARAEAALKCGADLCILLPTPWSMSCANNFALGGVSLLQSLGCVDGIAFGSECGDADMIIRVAAAAHSDEISALLCEELKDGTTFAKARQNALQALIGNDANILSSPNDTLATEYVAAAASLNFDPEFFAIKRTGCLHDSTDISGEFASASAIRGAVKVGNIDSVIGCMPQRAAKILLREQKGGGCADIKNIEGAILAQLRRLVPDDFKKIPEVGEGLENKIVAAVSSSTTLSHTLEAIKSKRYTMARIRRILISAFLGFDMTFFGQPVPYIKILGFNKTGEQILRDAKPSVPLINRSRDYLSLTDDAKKCFQIQNTAADLYALAYDIPRPCGRELSAGIIKI